MSFAEPNDKILLKLLDASAMRYKVLTNNLTNQHTPGYKRSTVKFEDLLAKEMTHTKPDVSSITPEIHQDLVTPAGPDGNNVNAELELNAMMQNRLQYELYSTLLGGRMELLRTAIQDGR
jgi:flagellar basal-body rod protein FlgB